MLATDRPHALRAGDSRLPQGRHRLDPRRLRRLARQDSARRGVRQGPDVQDGADARAALHAAAAGPHRAAARSIRRSHHPPPAARRRAAGLRDVQRKAGRLHQGGAAAMRTGRACGRWRFRQPAPSCVSGGHGRRRWIWPAATCSIARPRLSACARIRPPGLPRRHLR